MLDLDLEVLRKLGAALAAGENQLEFRSRVEIERALFNVAKHIAQLAFDFHITGFSFAAHEVMLEHVRLKPHLKEEAAALAMAFELTAIGAALSSGNAYVRKDIELNELDGRRGALKVYGCRLAKYAVMVDAVRNPDRRGSR